MGKIMEVLEVKPDFKKNLAKIKLGDTSFSSFGKKFGSVPGQTVDNISDGEYLGYEVIHDLYGKELALYNRLEAWKEKVNQWIEYESERYGRGIMDKFYTSSSFDDYRNKFQDGSLADWEHLTSFVNAEKMLYKYTYDGDMHLKYLQNYLKEWSKGRRYGSNTEALEFFLHPHLSIDDVYIESTTHNLSVSLRSGGGRGRICAIKNLDNIPEGQTAHITVTGYRFSSGGEGEGPRETYYYAHIYIAKNSINNDSYYTYSITHEFDEAYYYGHINKSDTTATHFDGEDITFNWIDSRHINV